MYTDEELETLAKEEDGITEKALISMIALVRKTNSELAKELTDFYNKYGKDGIVTYAEANKWVSERNHSHRLTALLFAINFAFRDLNNPIKIKFEKMIESIADREGLFFDIDLELEKLKTQKWGVDDKNWEQRLNNNLMLLEAKTILDIKHAIATREPLPTVLEKVDKRFDSFEKTLTTLAITECAVAITMGRRMIFKALNLNSYRYYARQDERTCEICGDLHGRIFPLSQLEVGVNAPSMHPRCRCWIKPL